MNRVRGLKKSALIRSVSAVLVLTVMMIFVQNVSASTDSTASNINLAGVTLAQNSSYVSDDYFGVIHLNVADSSIACASIDGKNHVVVTAVGTGSTTVSFWYKKTSDDGWVSATLPVKVSGQSAAGTTVSSYEAGVVFAPSDIGLSKGAEYIADHISINGMAVKACDLLWVSSSDSVATVDKTSGKITGIAAGTATVYAIDPATKCCGALSVKVS